MNLDAIVFLEALNSTIPLEVHSHLDPVQNRYSIEQINHALGLAKVQKKGYDNARQQLIDQNVLSKDGKSLTYEGIVLYLWHRHQDSTLAENRSLQGRVSDAGLNIKVLSFLFALDKVGPYMQDNHLDPSKSDYTLNHIHSALSSTRIPVEDYGSAITLLIKSGVIRQDHMGFKISEQSTIEYLDFMHPARPLPKKLSQVDRGRNHSANLRSK